MPGRGAGEGALGLLEALHAAQRIGLDGGGASFGGGALDLPRRVHRGLQPAVRALAFRPLELRGVPLREREVSGAGQAKEPDGRRR